MNSRIWIRKLNDKYRFTAAYITNDRFGKDIVIANGSKNEDDGLPNKDKYNKTNYHKKRDAGKCRCGLHSISAHKERDKYARWKRFRNKKYNKRLD